MKTHKKDQKISSAFVVPLFSDIEECESGVHNCDADANCTNIKGSFYCTCHTGFSGDGISCVGK